MTTTLQPVDDPAAAGREALARGAWGEARACFESALANGAGAGGWEGLSWALRMALWLANDALDFRGDDAVARSCGRSESAGTGAT